MSNDDLHKELLGSDIGSRHPDNSFVHSFTLAVALVWSLFQLWIASPLQFFVSDIFCIDWLVLNESKSRAIHLSFAVFLAFLAFPFSKKSPISYIPLYDWFYALVAGFCSLYIIIFYQDISLRFGLPSQVDILVSSIGLLLLLEAARRTMGAPISIIAILFILYCYFGYLMPELFSHKGSSVSKIVSHQWLTTEGVLGVALGVSSGFVFLYVLFGSLLEKAGAGKFFIKLSFTLLSKFTGGPAKAAVVASGLMGMMSGSSIANTVTVGTFTIPLMQKMGLSSEKSAAIEVSAGINGQIMPPVMGAAAFLMAEFIAIPYSDIIKYAFLPAILVYVALLYMVHLEALKLGQKPVDFHDNGSTSRIKGFYYGLLGSFIKLSSLVVAVGFIYFLIEGYSHLDTAGEVVFTIPGIKDLFGHYSFYAIICIVSVIYVSTLYYQSKLKHDDNEDNVDISYDKVNVTDIIKSGVHFFIPIFILIWTLTVERLSPALSAYWVVIILAILIVTQNPIKLFFQGKIDLIGDSIFKGFSKLKEGLILGAKNMVGVAIATATAGIIVGSVSLTGAGQMITEVVSHIAANNVFMTLMMTSVICIILGMGMPTTACYIIVSSIMVPVLVHLTIFQGMNIPLIALHLFVFYFGLMADVTPPVGLASYAAAAIAKANPISTGLQAFVYNMRTMALPFLFVFNSDLILYNITDVLDLVYIMIVSFSGILLVSAGLQGYFVVFNKKYESVLLVIIGLSLMYPQFWINRFFDEFTQRNVNYSSLNIIDTKDVSSIKMKLEKVDKYGDLKSRYALLDALDYADLGTVFSSSGFSIDSNMQINEVIPKSKAYKILMETGYKVTGVYFKNIQPNNKLVILVMFIILYFIYFMQTRRRNSE